MDLKNIIESESLATNLLRKIFFKSLHSLTVMLGRMCMGEVLVQFRLREKKLLVFTLRLLSVMQLL